VPSEFRVLPSAPPPIPDDNRILYYDRDRTAFRFLSHFWPSPVELDGEVWPTVEHYYQSQKSLDPEYRAAIRDAGRPGRAKQLAAPPEATSRQSKRSWFKKTGNLPRPDWHDVKLDIMRRADHAKYFQNPQLGALLLATGDAELVEDSPGEPYWGTGQDGQGLNWAGRVLMEVRVALAQR
jgi:N-glycosidase YbiA